MNRGFTFCYSVAGARGVGVGGGSNIILRGCWVV